jgi:hypothetical protein
VPRPWNLISIFQIFFDSKFDYCIPFESGPSLQSGQYCQNQSSVIGKCRALTQHTSPWTVRLPLRELIIAMAIKNVPSIAQSDCNLTSSHIINNAFMVGSLPWVRRGWGKGNSLVALAWTSCAWTNIVVKISGGQITALCRGGGTGPADPAVAGPIILTYTATITFICTPAGPGCGPARDVRDSSTRAISRSSPSSTRPHPFLR